MPGYYGPYGLAAAVCPAGSFCPAGSTAAQACPANKQSPAGAADVSACVVLKKSTALLSVLDALRDGQEEACPDPFDSSNLLLHVFACAVVSIDHA